MSDNSDRLHNKCFMLMHTNEENSAVNEGIVLEWVVSSIL